MGNEEDKATCGRPCPYSMRCSNCEEYWQNMINEGFFDPNLNQWTDKGIKQWTDKGIKEAMK